MDEVLIEKIREKVPPFNRTIVDGIACEHMSTDNLMSFVDQVIHVNSRLFPEGLVYEGSAVCPPHLQFEEVTREYSSRRKANIAQNDVVLAEYKFSYKGQMLRPRYVLLPFVRRGGIFYLNGALHNVAPVLADLGFSIVKGTVFIPFRRSRKIYHRMETHYLESGQRNIVYLMWGKIHNERKKLRPSDIDHREDIETTLVHYFFARFGVVETFKTWAKATVKICWKSELKAKDYPVKDWMIFESIKLKNKHPTGDLCLVVKRSQDSEFLRQLVGGFFYVVDVFPNLFGQLEDVSETIQWQRLLGRLIYGDYTHEGRIVQNVQDHLISEEASLDEMTMEDLRNAGVKANNIWELMYAIMVDLSKYFYDTSLDEASMWGKRFVVLPYVLREFNQNISNFTYAVHSQPDKEWTVDELEKLLRKYFKITACTKDLSKNHGEVNTVSYPGDNMFTRVTCMMFPQDRVSGHANAGKGAITDASRVFHVSVVEVCQFNNQPKNSADGRGRISPYLDLDVNGTVLRDKDQIPYLDTIQKMISG